VRIEIGRKSSGGEFFAAYEGTYTKTDGAAPGDRATIEITYTAYADASKTALNPAATTLQLERLSSGHIVGFNPQFFGAAGTEKIPGNPADIDTYGLRLYPYRLNDPETQTVTPPANAGLVESYTGIYNTDQQMASVISFSYAARIRLYDDGTALLEMGYTSGAGDTLVAYEGTYTKAANVITITYAADDTDGNTVLALSVNATTGHIADFDTQAVFHGNMGGAVIGTPNQAKYGITDWVLMRNQ